VIETAFEAAIVKALGSIMNGQESAHKQTEANEEWWRWPPSPSCAMVFVTLIYVGVALFQLGAISRQANIAEKSANAAKLSADVAEQALTLENRPWINVPNKGWRWRDGSAPGPDSKIVVDFTIENFGKRPAWITKLFARMETIYIGDRILILSTIQRPILSTLILRTKWANSFRLIGRFQDAV
jgi:hypothetical protein